MKKMFDQDILKNATYLRQYINPTGIDMFDYADKLLKRLSAAHLVVTSRLHIALPCLAIGVPVIFVNGGLYTLPDAYRLGGLVEFMNQIHISKDYRITNNFEANLPITKDIKIENPARHLEYADKLAANCRQFVASCNR